VVECSTTTTSVPPIDIISIVPSWIWILVVIILIVGLFVILSVSYHRKNEVVIYHDKPNVSSGLDTYAEIIDRSSLTKY
jgi:heme/copper-type cytochrome/quinol oxidase subunit 2